MTNSVFGGIETIKDVEALLLRGPWSGEPRVSPGGMRSRAHLAHTVQWDASERRFSDRTPWIGVTPGLSGDQRAWRPIRRPTTRAASIFGLHVIAAGAFRHAGFPRPRSSPIAPHPQQAVATILASRTQPRLPRRDGTWRNHGLLLSNRDLPEEDRGIPGEPRSRLRCANSTAFWGRWCLRVALHSTHSDHRRGDDASTRAHAARALDGRAIVLRPRPITTPGAGLDVLKRNTP